MGRKKKYISAALVVLLILFIGLQFFAPEKNIYDEVPPTDIAKVEDLPQPVMNILVESCYDCHSNNTAYPWYNNISPVNLFLDKHVQDGKKHLNFSDWGNYPEKRKKHKIKEIGELVEAGEMPLESYLWIHAEAKLSNKEKSVLLSWVKNYE